MVTGTEDVGGSECGWKVERVNGSPTDGDDAYFIGGIVAELGGKIDCDCDVVDWYAVERLGLKSGRVSVGAVDGVEDAATAAGVDGLKVGR